MAKTGEVTNSSKLQRDIASARTWLDHRTADAAATTCFQGLDALERELMQADRFAHYIGVATATAAPPANPFLAAGAPPAVVTPSSGAAAPRAAAPLVVAPPRAAAPPLALPAAAPPAARPVAAAWPGTTPAAPPAEAPPPPAPAPVNAPPLPEVSAELVEYFRPKNPDGSTKARAAGEMIRAMLVCADEVTGACLYTDLEIAAAVKAAYPDLSALVYRYPNEARGRLKKAGTPVPPAREV